MVPQGENDEPADQLLARILAERRAQWEAGAWQTLIVKAQKKAAQAGRKAQGRPARAKDLQPGEWEMIPEAVYARYLPKDDKWTEKYKEPVGVETAVLPDLPDGWVYVTVEQLAAHEPQAITDGPFGSKLKTSHYTKSGPRVIRLQNIGNGEFIDEYAHISEEHYDFLSKHRVYANDLARRTRTHRRRSGAAAVRRHRHRASHHRQPVPRPAPAPIYPAPCLHRPISAARPGIEI